MKGERSLKVISPPNVAPREDDLTSMESGSVRPDTLKQNFGAELVEEKKDDDVSREGSAAPADSIKASEEQSQGGDSAHK